MFLEKDKAAESTEPVNSGSMDGSAGEPLLTGASTPAIKRDRPVLPNTQINCKCTGPFPHTQYGRGGAGILRIRGMVGQECVAKIGDWGDGQTCGL